MTNVLNYFRIKTKGSKARAAFITETYGKSKAKSIAKAMRDQSLQDFLLMVCLKNGSDQAVIDFLAEVTEIALLLDTAEAATPQKK